MIQPLSQKKNPTEIVTTFYSRISFLCRRTPSSSSSRDRRLEHFTGKLLVEDRLGSSGAFHSLPPSPAIRPVIAEVTRLESIGDALALTDRPFPGVNRYFLF